MSNTNNILRSTISELSSKIVQNNTKKDNNNDNSQSQGNDNGEDNNSIEYAKKLQFDNINYQKDKKSLEDEIYLLRTSLQQISSPVNLKPYRKLDNESDTINKFPLIRKEIEREKSISSLPVNKVAMTKKIKNNNIDKGQQLRQNNMQSMSSKTAQNIILFEVSRLHKSLNDLQNSKKDVESKV